MKKIYLFIVFLTLNLNAQISEYYIIEDSNNNWDESMQTYKGWSDWSKQKQGEYKGSSFSNSYDNKTFISSKVIKLFFRDSYANDDESYITSDETVFLFNLTENQPTAKIKMYFKDVKIKYEKIEKSYKYEDPEYNFYKPNNNSGIGMIYSFDFTFDELISGNAVGQLYFDYTVGSVKNKYAVKLKSKIIFENEKRQVDIENFKKEKRSESINALGNSLLQLLKK